MHPQLELIDQLIRIVGWPTLAGGFIWAVRKWDAGQRDFQDLHESTKVAVATMAVVKSEVDTIKNNHLAHLQDGIGKLAASNDKAVEVLQQIDTGIKVLIDRTPRA